jgi:hypothetical protein
MTSDPEPSHFIVLQKSGGAVSEGHANGVDRVLLVGLLKCRPGCLGFSRKEPAGYSERRPGLPQAARGTLPRSAAWRATSQLLGVEGGGSTSRAVGSGFSRKLAQRVL